MNDMKKESIKEQVISFWNSHFQNLQPMAIKKEDIILDTPLDECLQILGDECSEVLDIACGNGLCLIETKLIGNKTKKGLGFDTSKNAIENAKEIVHLSNLDNLNFVTADEGFLSSLEANSYDGIFCSNFLDVVPDEISLKVIANIKRIHKPNGLLLLKLNFHLSYDLIAKLRMEKVTDNCYAINGVFRANNKSTDEWLSLFDGYKAIKITGFQRAPNLPEDRLLLLKKLS